MKNNPKYVWGECMEISTLLGRFRKIHVKKKQGYIYGGDMQHEENWCMLSFFLWITIADPKEEEEKGSIQEDFRSNWWREFEKIRTTTTIEYYFGIHGT